jgi:hypothetical protein
MLGILWGKPAREIWVVNVLAKLYKSGISPDGKSRRQNRNFAASRNNNNGIHNHLI